MSNTKNTENTIAQDVAAIVAKHGATAVLDQLAMAANMVSEHGTVCKDWTAADGGWAIRKALLIAMGESHALDKHLAKGRTSTMGMASALDILYRQERNGA